jgi:hypothetical protein
VTRRRKTKAAKPAQVDAPKPARHVDDHDPAAGLTRMLNRGAPANATAA